MAVSTGVMMALNTGLSMYGQIQQGKAMKAAGDMDARLSLLQARQVEDQAEQEADRIRRAGRKTSGAARAQMAANGVNVNAGTSLLIEDEIEHDSERDAQMTLLTGKRRGDAARFAGGQAAARGVNAQYASSLGAVSTGLQGWKGVKQTQQGDGYRYKVPTYDGAEY
jgi:hypothetical protein